MRVAITGHSEGIGKSFSEILTERGHEVVGLSRRNGHNIRSLHKIIGQFWTIQDYKDLYRTI